MNVLKKLFVFVILAVLTYGLFVNSFYPLGNGELQSVLPSTINQIVFCGISLVCFLFLYEMRVVVLTSFLVGFLALLFLPAQFRILGYDLPHYGLISLNGVWLLFIYFLLTGQKWTPRFT